MQLLTDSYEQPDSILLVAYPGTGKTTLALQFPGVFVLDCDANQKGPIEWLKQHGKFKPVFYGSPLFDENKQPVPRLDQYKRAAELLMEAASSPDVKTIFIDSATTFCDIVMTEVYRQQGRKLGSIFNPTKTIKSADDQTQQQDWGVFYGMMKRIIFELKSSGKLLILAAHIKSNADPSGATEKNIAIPGQTGELIAGWFGEVWKLERRFEGVGDKRKEKRVICINPSGKSEDPLGLKTAVGIKDGTLIDSDDLLKAFK